MRTGTNGTPVRVPVLAALTVFLFYAQAHAETTKGSATSGRGKQKQNERRVTWSDIVRLVDKHPTMATGRYRTLASRAAIDAAKAVPNPSIGAAVAYGRARDGSASRVEWGIELSIPLGWIAQRGAKVDAAQAEAQVAEAESKALRRDVLLQLWLLFWNLAHEQERVAALVALDAQTASLAGAVRRRVDKGERRPVEATRVEIEAEKVAGELAIARSTLETRRAQLGIWLGGVNGGRLTAVADLTKVPRTISMTAARAGVRTAPAIIAARARLRAIQANVSLERHVRIPNVSMQAFTDHELDRTAYGVGLSVGLPIWNWNSGNIRQAEASLAAGRTELDAKQRAIASEVFAAQASCTASVGLAARYRQRVRPRAAAAAKTIERSYQLGEATLLEVIDARRTLLTTRTQLLAALAKAQTECGRLAVLAGEELQ